MIERVGSQASERRTERSGGRNPLGLRSGRSRKSRSLRRAGRVIPPNPTRPARSHYWPNHERKLRDEWAYLRQTTTVAEFYSRVTQLAMELSLTDEEQLLDKFIRGLKSRTQTEVELRDPKTLLDTSKIADRFDTIVYRKQPLFRPQYSNPSTFVEDNRGEPMLIDSLRQVPRQSTRNPARIDAFKAKPRPGPLKKLSDEERTYLVSIDACFKCRKPGHMARNCPKGNLPSSGNSKRQ